MQGIQQTEPQSRQRSLLRNAVPGVIAGVGYGAFVGVPRAYLPASAPQFAARRAPQVALTVVEAATIGATITAVSHRNNDGTPSRIWESGAVAAAATAPLFLVNTIRTRPHGSIGFAVRLAAGAGIGFGIGTGLHVATRP